MDRYELIQEFNKTIIDIYTEEKLQCLSWYIKGKQVTERYFEITTKCKIKNNSDFDCTKIFDDIVFVHSHTYKNLVHLRISPQNLIAKYK